jgi:tetratricopeptide (TPR) repeat protein
MDAQVLELRVGALEKALPDFSGELRLALRYIDQDAASSLTKSRIVLERLLVTTYTTEMGQEPRKPLLGDMLADNQFTRKIERRMLSRMNAVRDMGNLGPHGESVEPSDAAKALDDLCDVLDWYLGRYARARPAAPGEPAAKLPPRKPDFCFGRDVELARLIGFLAPADPSARVPATPVSGIGGIGKSTLVLTALWSDPVVARYGDRRHFVRLDGATRHGTVVAAVAEEVGVPLGDRLEARLFDFLRQSAPRLLVLDNAETPLLGEDRLEAEELFQQLAGLPALAIVATLRGVAPPGPGWRAPLELRRLDDAAARETFLAGTGGKFADDPALDALLRELDGWPLALTVLAYQGRFYVDVRELAGAWRRKRTDLLTKGVKKRDADIGACIELSLGSPLMTEEARRLLGLLGILPDGIRRDDLEALLPPDGPDAAATLRHVGGLTFDDGPRIRVLAPVRDYLAAKHPPRPEDREWAITYYCAVADFEGNKAGKEGGAEAILRVAAEAGNLVGMVGLGLEAPAAVPAFRGAWGLGEFSRFSGIDLSAILVEAERVAGDRGQTLEQARCLRRLGDIALYRSDHGEARRLVGDVPGPANCVKGLGDIALERSEHAEARRRYEEALGLYLSVGSVLGQAHCTSGLGDIALARMDHAEARRRYDEALPLFLRVGDVLGQALCTSGLGDIALARSEYEEARRRYEEALRLYLSVGSVFGQAHCTSRLGDIALAHSDHAEARRCYDEALPLFLRVGSVLGQANCVRGLGDIVKVEGNLSTAREQFEEALALYQRIPDPYSIGGTHRRLARITDGDERQRHVQAACDAWTCIDQPDLVAELNREFGDDWRLPPGVPDVRPPTGPTFAELPAVAVVPARRPASGEQPAQRTP